MIKRVEWPDATMLICEVDDFDLVLPTRYNVKDEDTVIGDDPNLDITVSYRFTESIRKNQFKLGTYGSYMMTCRRLHHILVHRFNGGVDFIQVYFEKYFKYTFGAKIERLVNILRYEMAIEREAILQEILYRKNGIDIDKRSKGSKRLSGYQLWKNKKLKDHMSEMSKEIRDDIKHCLSSGLLYIRAAEATTLKRRFKLGLDAIHPFYASGFLIDHLIVYYKVEFDGGVSGT